MRTILIAIICCLSIGCATVEMPIEGGKSMTFKGFASNMTVTVPSGVDEAGNALPDKIVKINAHILEGPAVEAIKTIAPFAAMAVQ